MKRSTQIKLGLGLTVVLTLSQVLNELEYKTAFDPKKKIDLGKNSEDQQKQIEEGIALIQDKKQKFEITNEHGDVLKATFVPAKEGSKKYVVLSHGYRNSGLNEFGLFLPFYYEQNVNLLIVDHQAHGESEGKNITFGSREHVDLELWIQHLVDSYGEDIQIYLHGISMGATTVLCTVNNIPSNVKGILADCGYASAQDQLVHTMKQNHIPLPRASYHLINYKLKRRYHADLQEINAKKVLKSTEVPIKIIHGEKDTFVPVQNALDIYNSIQSDNKEMIIIEGAEHAKSYMVDPATYQAKIKEILEYE
ncbi:MAG: alpha/beta hydrolase [Firmicutes bacterium]|nr:alpha/beta hydrolase [Bacillota bacterium]